MINLSIPRDEQELKPRITVVGVGGAGGNAVNNMIRSNLIGCEFVVCNTDAQAMQQVVAERRIQLGVGVTRGLGAGSRPDVGRIAAEEALDEIIEPRSTAPTWCSSPPAWAAAPAPARRRSSPASPREAGHPDGRRRHQAVPLRGHAPHAARRGRHRSSCRNSSTR